MVSSCPKYDISNKVDPTLFRKFVWNLRYLTYTKSDICFGVILVNHFLEAPNSIHILAAKKEFYGTSKMLLTLGYIILHLNFRL